MDVETRNIIAALEARISALEAQLSHHTPPKKPHPVRDVVRQVSGDFGVAAIDILGPSREARIATARQEVMRRAHDDCGVSYASIGRAIGRDHTTVIHGAQRARERMQK